MEKKPRRTGMCQISKREHPLSELMPASFVREPILNFIQDEYPDWDPEGYIAITELNKFRYIYIEKLLEAEKGRLTKLEEDVVGSLKGAEILSKNLSVELEEKLTVGEKLADKMAKLAGSWHFILSFFAFMIFWIVLNVYLLLSKPFDPYPFILLNLILSCLAAIQAPIIIMSQNRQETKDRLRSQHDYQINLKAELEIQDLHEKMDHLIIYQGQRLIEIQQVQMEFMEEILNLIKSKKGIQDKESGINIK